MATTAVHDADTPSESTETPDLGLLPDTIYIHHDKHDLPWPVILFDDSITPEFILRNRQNNRVKQAFQLGRRMFIWLYPKNLEKYDSSHDYLAKLEPFDQPDELDDDSDEVRREKQRRKAFTVDVLQSSNAAYWRHFWEQGKEANKIKRLRKSVKKDASQGPSQQHTPSSIETSSPRPERSNTRSLVKEVQNSVQSKKEKTDPSSHLPTPQQSPLEKRPPRENDKAGSSRKRLKTKDAEHRLPQEEIAPDNDELGRPLRISGISQKELKTKDAVPWDEIELDNDELGRPLRTLNYRKEVSHPPKKRSKDDEETDPPPNCAAFESLTEDERARLRKAFNAPRLGTTTTIISTDGMPLVVNRKRALESDYLRDLETQDPQTQNFTIDLRKNTENNLTAKTLIPVFDYLKSGDIPIPNPEHLAALFLTAHHIHHPTLQNTIYDKFQSLYPLDPLTILFVAADISHIISPETEAEINMRQWITNHMSNYYWVIMRDHPTFLRALLAKDEDMREAVYDELAKDGKAGMMGLEDD